MISYTFEIIKRKTNNDNLYDIFMNTIVDRKVQLFQNVVQENEEGRLDLFCKRIYGTTNYVEELMVINNIINPFSIVNGQILYYCKLEDIETFRNPEKDEEISENLASPKNKNTRKDPNRVKGVPPTIKPLNFKQILVDKKNKTIKLNNKLL